MSEASPSDVVDENLLAGELAALKIANQLMAAVRQAPTLGEVMDVVTRAAAYVDEAPLAEAIYVATAKAAMLGADDSEVEAEDETVIAPDRFARWGGCPVHTAHVDGEPDPCSADLSLGTQTTSQAINVSEQGPALLATEPPSPASPATPPGSAFGVDAAGESCSGALVVGHGSPSSSAESSEPRGMVPGASGFCGVDSDAAPCLSVIQGRPEALQTPVVARSRNDRRGARQDTEPAWGREAVGAGVDSEPCCAADDVTSPVPRLPPPVVRLGGRETPRASAVYRRPAPISAAARAGRPGSKSFTDAVLEFRSRGAVTRDVFDAMTAEERARSFTVARMLTDKSVAVVQDEVARAIESGESLRKFRVNLRQRMQSSGIAIAPHWRSRGGDATLGALDASHVETIYRNGVMSAYSAGRAKHMTQPHIVAARPYWQNMTVNDGPPRQRKTHQAVHGWVMRADDPGWQTTYAPHGHQCFLPGTLIQGRFLGASRALYAGKAIELTTAKGRRLTVTAQHPILTLAGPRKAASLRQGDQLVCHRREIEDGAVLSHAPGGQPDKHEQPAEVKDVFRALVSASEGLWANAGPNDFHGEAKRFHGQIHVVGSYRQLQHGIASVGDGQVPLEFSQQLALVSANPAESALMSTGGEQHLATRAHSASRAIPGAGTLAFDDLPVVRHRSPLQPLQPLSRGPAAYLDPRLPEAAGEDVAGYASFVGQLLHAGAGQVLLDEIVEVREFEFLGHVYDFHTETGWVVADGIFSSNCRCRTITRSRKWVERNSPHMHTGPLPRLPDPGWTCRPPPVVSIPPEPPPKPNTKDDPPLQPPPSRGKSLVRPGDEQLDNETRASLERLDGLDKDERGRISMRALGFQAPEPADVDRVKELLKLRGAALEDAFGRALGEPMASYEIATSATVDGAAAADAARAWDSTALPRVLRLRDGTYHLLDGEAAAAAQASSIRGLSPLGGLRARVVNAPLNRLPKAPTSRRAALQELGESTHLADLIGDQPSQARMRLALQDILKGDGMISRDNLEIRALGERLRIIRANVIRGQHAWTGEIEISAPVFEHAKAGLTAARAGKELTSQQQRAISTLFHEEIHGASPMARSAYQAHGAALEEASAEILARRQARKLLGLKPGVDDPLGLPTKPITSKAGAGEMAKFRAYEGPVSRLLATVARFDVPAADVEAALIRMRAAGAARYETADAYLTGFVAELPVAEGQARLLYGQLRRALRSTTLELERATVASVYELERNDTEGAVRVFEAAVARASETELQDLARMLARLQDSAASAAELLGYFEELGAARPLP